MIHISKTEPPELLKKKAQEWQLRLDDARRLGDEAESKRVEKYYNKPEIRDALLRETHGKCAYCETRIGSVGVSRIEHIKPRREAPEMTFEWSNLTIACETCNGRKSDYWSEELPLLNPYQDDPRVHLWFAGVVVEEWDDSPVGMQSISRLDLNRADLLEWRRIRSKRVQSLINKHRLADTEGEREGYWQALENELAEDKEYLLMLRGLIRGYGDSQT